MYNQAAKYSLLIKKEALRLGFMACGIAKAEFLEDEAPRLEKWLQNNHHGEMSYMENNFDKRLDPRLLVENAQSVISLTLNYFTNEKQVDPNAPRISTYAYGEDYHHVIKEKLKELMAFINNEIGEVAGRCFVDSAPVMDKAWAQKSGLGWRGKNSNLISKDNGSFFFLAELIIDLELDYDRPFVADHCGSCTRCIDACPTDAIVAPYVVDGSKCISYLTIELKNEIPISFKDKMENWMFGCDICQDVCPWNRFATQHQEPAFKPSTELLQFTRRDLIELTEDVFKKIFKGSAVKRTKFIGLKRNIDFLKIKLCVIAILLAQLTYAQKLKLPTRKADARVGSAFANSISDSTLSLTNREQLIYGEIKKGNVPNFLRKLSSVEYETMIDGQKYKITFLTVPDYMAIGSDNDYFYVPMTPILAQKVAKLIGASLPTKKMVDLIYQNAQIKLSPSPITPTKAMTTVPVFIAHNRIIKEQMKGSNFGLTAGHKKDIIISNKIYTEKTNKVVIYGWHQLNGKAIQPVYNKHSNTWADYSHGVRFIQNKVIVNDKKTTFRKILTDSNLHLLLSDEGVIQKPYYP